MYHGKEQADFVPRDVLAISGAGTQLQNHEKSDVASQILDRARLVGKSSEGKLQL